MQKDRHVISDICNTNMWNFAGIEKKSVVVIKMHVKWGTESGAALMFESSLKNRSSGSKGVLFRTLTS